MIARLRNFHCIMDFENVQLTKTLLGSHPHLIRTGSKGLKYFIYLTEVLCQ